MTKITVLIGISGSGKSTRARELHKENPRSIIVSRDKLREMLFGYSEVSVKEYYSSPDLYIAESQVSHFQEKIMIEALNKGLSVIVDATHLKLRYINQIKKKFSEHEIEFELIECDLDKAIFRDQLRDRQVGVDVIKKQALDLRQLKSIFDFKTYSPEVITPLVQDTELQEAFIFDIDGTLAKMTGRSPYDYSQVHTDVVNKTIVDLCHSLNDDYPIIICTGRDAICKEATKEWLANNGIWYHELHIRAQGDQRKDYIVKEEMWRDISKRYNIIGMVDDRLSVIQHARRLGFCVLDVAGGTF